MRRGIRICEVVVVTALSASCLACADMDNKRTYQQTEEVGSLGFALTLPQGKLFELIEYEISGPGGYSKTGQLRTAGSEVTFSARIDGLPAGNGYALRLSVPGFDCSGKAQFDIRPGTVSRVSVRLSCHIGRDKDNNSVRVEGSLNICPAVEFAHALPSGSAATPLTFALTAEASDEDEGPDPLKYNWYASAGVIERSSTGSPELHCPAQGGDVQLRVEVSDGECQDSLTLERLTCPANPVADAGTPPQCTDQQDFAGVLVDQYSTQHPDSFALPARLMSVSDCSAGGCRPDDPSAAKRYTFETQQAGGSPNVPPGTRFGLIAYLAGLPNDQLAVGHDYVLKVVTERDDSPFSGGAVRQIVTVSEQQTPVLMLADVVATDVMPDWLDAFGLHFARGGVSCGLPGFPFRVDQYSLHVTSPTESVVIAPGMTARVGAFSISLVSYTTAYAANDTPEHLQLGLFRSRP